MEKFNGIVYLITWSSCFVKNSLYVNFHSVTLRPFFMVDLGYSLSWLNLGSFSSVAICLKDSYSIKDHFPTITNQENVLKQNCGIGCKIIVMVSIQATQKNVYRNQTIFK